MRKFRLQMDYAKQHEFLSRSRVWGSALVIALMAMAAAWIETSENQGEGVAIAFGFTMAALAISLWYSPDYLHLTVNPNKTRGWEIKIRWRVIAALLLMGLLLAGSIRGVIELLAAVAWLAGANFLAQAAVPSKWFPAYYWATDLILLVVFLLVAQFNLLLGVAMVAAAAHLSIVICKRHTFRWAAVVSSLGGLLILFAASVRGANPRFSAMGLGLLLLSSLGTASLVHRAQGRNNENTATAMRDLMDFTGYSGERIRQLWETSNGELAKNWQAAGIPENDGEQMAFWYRENSELYLFAIDGYNLDYKRIRSNLCVLEFARGSCLDYGAGNGELVLELARRGHAATYFDVEGCTMQFAHRRAQTGRLAIEFFHSKDALATAMKNRGFETIYCFDVLEHLPDLPGELDFLTSLLCPGGLLIFDVPAGSTKSHPMHLNHTLDVRAYLAAKGLEEQRTLVQQLLLVKQEKFIFRAPATELRN